MANKVVDGKQCTVAWYVDDNKISHVDSKVVDSVIDMIESKFGTMTKRRGKNHVFVGMDIEFMGEGKVKILMKEYLEESIVAFGEDLGKKANTPAKGDLFTIDEESEDLDADKSERFHHIVSKLLFVSKRARLDIELAISFLCTRVSKSTMQDWEKLRRLLSYLQCTIDMPRIIGANGFEILQPYVEASYATHNDMRGHTGGLMTLGHGIVHDKCSKQKLNTKSSTETEVIGASDYIGHTLFTKWFLKAQGYEVRKNIFYQDNMSAMKMEKNGRQSCRESLGTFI